MEPKVLIVGTDINAYYMARCYHEIYHKKVGLIGRVAMSFTSLSTITNVNIIPNLIEGDTFVNSLIEYAAEMGLEHNLGLTCDPVGGYVQIPCIERNGFGALRAIDAASYAKQLGYLRKNKVSFDSIVNVMKETGKDLNSAYKETSLGGLAKEFGLKDGD